MGAGDYRGSSRREGEAIGVGKVGGCERGNSRSSRQRDQEAAGVVGSGSERQREYKVWGVGDSGSRTQRVQEAVGRGGLAHGQMVAKSNLSQNQIRLRYQNVTIGTEKAVIEFNMSQNQAP